MLLQQNQLQFNNSNTFNVMTFGMQISSSLKPAEETLIKSRINTKLSLRKEKVNEITNSKRKNFFENVKLSKSFLPRHPYFNLTCYSFLQGEFDAKLKFEDQLTWSFSGLSNNDFETRIFSVGRLFDLVDKLIPKSHQELTSLVNQEDVSNLFAVLATVNSKEESLIVSLSILISLL